jgi:hypothetical protein
MMLMGMLVAFAAMAATAAATPKGEFAVFAQCPLSNANVEACTVAKSEKGKFIIGAKEVPIEKAITLQGGLGEANPCEPPFTQKGACRRPFYGAANGETLSKAAQNVPGGLLGLVNCKTIENALLRAACEFFFEHGITQVTATTELAGTPEVSEAALFEPILSEAFGIPAITLPIKIKLDNGLLGSSCYIGSAAEPIRLNLITGTTKPPAPNKPITGSVGTEESNEAGNIITIRNNKLVDNSFAAPGTNGCGTFGLLDPILNESIGVPSKAGTNTAVLEGKLQQAGAEAVKAHE